MPYDLIELSKEEGDKITEELKVILEKYDCEMQITSTITILKRVPKEENIESPYGNISETTEETNSETESGG